MKRRDFIKNSGKVVLATSTISLTGIVLNSCSTDDGDSNDDSCDNYVEGHYSDGYYTDGYYTDGYYSDGYYSDGYYSDGYYSDGYYVDGYYDC